MNPNNNLDISERTVIISKDSNNLGKTRIHQMCNMDGSLLKNNKKAKIEIRIILNFIN